MYNVYELGIFQFFSESLVDIPRYYGKFTTTTLRDFLSEIGARGSVGFHLLRRLKIRLLRLSGFLVKSAVDVQPVTH